ncbi:hypothetical protein, partial [Cronobacter malonaticus]|uniref:hypothetical protein n=1 Tax=Cronobacter malonaticus TaxID=413503 RepID=UPI001F3788D1
SGKKQADAASLTRPTCQNKSAVTGVVLLRLKKIAHQGPISAGSRDCKGGGGEPPLHVRVREKHRGK